MGVPIVFLSPFIHIFPPFLSQDNKDIQGYVHNVSPLQTSDGTKYFDCQIQLENERLRSVSFTPEKKAKLQSAVDSKSLLEILNFRRNLYMGNEILLLTRKHQLWSCQQIFDFQEIKQLTHLQ